jgi:hypothetical protein
MKKYFTKSLPDHKNYPFAAYDPQAFEATMLLDEYSLIYFGGAHDPIV